MKRSARRTWLMIMVLALTNISLDNDVSADESLDAGNAAITEEFKRTLDFCLLWRLRGRNLEYHFPRSEFLSQEDKLKIAKTAFSMIGDQADPPTSLSYMLHDMALNMYLSGHPPGEIEMAVFNFCSKYDAPYTKRSERGSDPNPRLRTE